MAVYGTSPFAKYSSHSFEKNVSPTSSFAAQPPMAWTQSSALASEQQQSWRFHQRPHASALAVLMLLACAFSAAYILKPDRSDGSGDMPDASYLVLLQRHAAKQDQHKGPAHCKLLYSGIELHTMDTTLCLEEATAGMQQQRIMIWRHSYKHREGGESIPEDASSSTSSSSSSDFSSSSSSSRSYPYNTVAGADYGRRKIKLHRKTLLHLVQH